MHYKVYFVVLIFIFYQSYSPTCENPSEINNIDVLNNIRVQPGWNEMNKTIVIEDPIDGKVNIEDLTEIPISEGNYDKAVEQFMLFLSCRYVQHLKALRITWLGFVESCREEEEKINFAFCVSKLYCVLKESSQMLIHMTDGLIDMEKLTSNTTSIYNKHRNTIMNFKEIVFGHIDKYPNPDFLNEDDDINEELTEDIFQSISDIVRQRIHFSEHDRNKGCTILPAKMSYFFLLDKYNQLLDKSRFLDDEYVYVSEKIKKFYNKVIEDDYIQLGLDQLKTIHQ